MQKLQNLQNSLEENPTNHPFNFQEPNGYKGDSESDKFNNIPKAGMKRTLAVSICKASLRAQHQ